MDVVVFKFREVLLTGNRQNRALFARQGKMAAAIQY